MHQGCFPIVESENEWAMKLEQEYIELGPTYLNCDRYLPARMDM